MITILQNLDNYSDRLDIILNVGMYGKRNSRPFTMREGSITELIRFAFTGINIVPTLMLVVIQIYWIIVSLGFFDFDFLDIDVDLEGAEGVGAINSLAVFMNYGNVPFGLVMSLLVLNFWILMMLTYYLPFGAGGVISAVLLIPAFIGSVLITKVEVKPLKLKFLKEKELNDIGHKVLKKSCRLMCDLEHGRLGQAEIDQNGASIVINVRTEFEDERFVKNEKAIVFRKDEEGDVYYISKL